MTALPIEYDWATTDVEHEVLAEVFNLAQAKAAKKKTGKAKAKVDPIEAGRVIDIEDLTWEAFVPVYSANIGRGVSQAKAKANINRVFRQSPLRGKRAFIGWQEIDEADTAAEHQILASHVRQGKVAAHAEHQEMLKRQQGYVFAGFMQATPIAVPAPWVIDNVVVTVTCKGRPKVTPHRVCVQAVCSHPQMPGYKVAFLNGHYPLARLGAEDLWDDCHEAWQQITKGYMLRGIPVVTTRDTNAIRMPKLVASEQQLLPLAINKVSLCMPADSEMKVKKVGQPKVIDLTIDGHDAKGVGLKFKVPQAA